MHSSPQEVAARIEAAFPLPTGVSAKDWKSQGWHVYDNPIEGKLALDDVGLMYKHDHIYRWTTLYSHVHACPLFRARTC